MTRKNLFSAMLMGLTPFVPAHALTADGSAEVSAPGKRVETETPSLLRVSEIKVAHADSTLNLRFEINPRRVKPGRDRRVVFTPVIRSNNPEVSDSIVLSPITIAGRNRYYSHLRNGDIAAGEPIYRAGAKGELVYERSVPWNVWMEDSYIYIREETQDCCRPVKPLCDTPLAQIGTIARRARKETNTRGYIALTGDSTIEREAQGRAFIDFIVNKTYIDENYRGNPVELKKIIESIDFIHNDPDAVITRLTVKGYASPEGSYENNVRLAMGRTEALKEYVRQMYNFDPEIMHTDYEPEDWEGLRNWLETSDIANRDAILEIVNSNLAPDPKDRAIKSRFPKEYDYILKTVYPALRHSDYTVRYKIRTYVDINDLKRVFQENPRNLRPVDFYRIAQTYPEGSNEFETVLLLASDIHPHDEQAAVNAANILMRRGQTKEASEKLNHAGESGEAYYSRGILAAMNEDKERALFFLEKARALGVADAAQKIDDIRESGVREVITYLIEEDDE